MQIFEYDIDYIVEKVDELHVLGLLDDILGPNTDEELEHYKEEERLDEILYMYLLGHLEDVEGIDEYETLEDLNEELPLYLAFELIDSEEHQGIVEIEELKEKLHELERDVDVYSMIDDGIIEDEDDALSVTLSEEANNEIKKAEKELEDAIEYKSETHREYNIVPFKYDREIKFQENRLKRSPDISHYELSPEEIEEDIYILNTRDPNVLKIKRELQRIYNDSFNPESDNYLEVTDNTEYATSLQGMVTASKRYGFLNRRQNIILSEAIQRHNREYDRAKHVPILYMNEEGELVEHPDRVDAIQMFMLTNLLNVVGIATSYNFPGVTTEDKVQIGIIGLHRAAEKYEAIQENGSTTMFITYSTSWIRQALTRQAPQVGRNITFPAHIQTLKNSVATYKDEFTKKNDREPSYEELEDYVINHMKFSRDSFYFLMEMWHDTDSLDFKLSGSSDTIDILESNILDNDENNRFEKGVESSDVKIITDEMLSILTPNERVIITMLYGLNNEATMQTKEIAAVSGVTSERIRQRKQAAISKMKEHAKAHNLNLGDFLS